MAVLRVFVLVALCALLLSAQEEPVAVFKSDVVSLSVNAINYQVLGKTSEIVFAGTAIMPRASGSAKVRSRQKYTEIEAAFDGLGNPSQFGAEYLTYVLWAVSPQGRPANLGEVLLDRNGRSKLRVTTESTVFALVVTAEPYFAVRQPTDLIVLLNELTDKVKGRVFFVDAKAELLKRGVYAKLPNPLGLGVNTRTEPLEMFQARNAIHIAKSFLAEKYAADTLNRGISSLQMAENALRGKKPVKDVVTLARESVQFAEESRALSVVRQEEEYLAQTMARAEAEEKARLQAEAARQAEEARRAEADAARLAEERRRIEAERARLEADQARLRAEMESAKEAARRAEAIAAQEAARREAEAAREMAEQERRAAEQARRAAEQAEAEKRELRSRLLQQFNQILETRDTDRGLVVNLGDVLFDTGKFTLRQVAREKLARLAGIVLSHPGLELETEGHTDTTGSEALNLRLSQQRADAVKQFLIEQGIGAERISSVGRGFSMPVAGNETAAGRQKNRRVEIIIFGEVIGTKIG